MSGQKSLLTSFGSRLLAALKAVERRQPHLNDATIGRLIDFCLALWDKTSTPPTLVLTQLGINMLKYLVALEQVPADQVDALEQLDPTYSHELAQSGQRQASVVRPGGHGPK